jgi:imidazolonepropionase-like amidohydrolase
MTGSAMRRGRMLPTVAASMLLLGAAMPAFAQTIAITGGKVYPVSGAPIENGTVLIRDGKIVAVGANVEIPAGAQRVDASGKIVTPGLVNPGTQLGLVEVGFSAGTRETNARARDAIAASFTSWEGLNPRSVLLAPARQDGITSVLALPGGGLISGQAALIDVISGGSVADMIVQAPAVMVGQITDGDAAGVGARGQLLGKLRELLDDAKYYASHRAAYDRAQTRPLSANRAELEAMIPVVEGRLPLMLTAEKATDIEAGLDLARRYGLKLIISGGAEAWMVADKLAAAKVPVLVGAMNDIPYAFTMLGARQDNAALLRKAGVTVALIGNAGGGDEELFNVRNLRYEAGNAVGHGMTWDDALRAVTLAPAEMLGVADRIGSLRPGREANVVVWDGDPFEFATRAVAVYVRGKQFTDPSRQDLLTERYKGR